MDCNSCGQDSRTGELCTYNASIKREAHQPTGYKSEQITTTNHIYSNEGFKSFLCTECITNLISINFKAIKKKEIRSIVLFFASFLLYIPINLEFSLIIVGIFLQITAISIFLKNRQKLKYVRILYSGLTGKELDSSQRAPYEDLIVEESLNHVRVNFLKLISEDKSFPDELKSSPGSIYSGMYTSVFFDFHKRDMKRIN